MFKKSSFKPISRIVITILLSTFLVPITAIFNSGLIPKAAALTATETFGINSFAYQTGMSVSVNGSPLSTTNQYNAYASNMYSGNYGVSGYGVNLQNITANVVFTFNPNHPVTYFDFQAGAVNGVQTGYVTYNDNSTENFSISVACCVATFSFTAASGRTIKSFTITSFSGDDYWLLDTINYTYSTTNTVTFDSNGGTGSPSVASVTQASTGATVSLATQNTLARSDFSYSGWNTAADGSGTTYAAGATYTPASSLTMYAQWNSTITYNSNTATSGSVPSATTAKSSAAVTTLASNSGTLAKTGYTYGGWNTATNGSGTSYAAGITNYASPGNTTLYAQWNSNITYLANGATSGSVPAVSSLYGTSGTLASNSGTLAKTNYTATGWNTNETGTGTSYGFSGAYTPSGNKSLYAEWSTVVTYNGNSNTTGSVPGATTIKGISGTLATNSGSLTQTGKVFAGWNTNSAGTGTWYAAGATYPNSGNITLYARWVTALSITGPSTLSVGQGIAFRSDTYTATSGLDTKTVTYSLNPDNGGITLETATVTGTTYAYIKVSSGVIARTYIDTLTAQDRMGTTVTLAVTIVVSSPLGWSDSNTATLVTTAGTARSLRLDVVNGFSGKAFTLTHMSTPSSTGVTLDTSTASSGYATLNVSNSVPAGTYVESITATDSSGRKIVSTVTITVNGKITVTKDGVNVSTPYTSLLYNGSTQASYLAPSTKYQVGSTWTLEWWQYQTDATSWPRVFSMGGGYFGVSLESDIFYFWASGAAYNMGSLGTTRKNNWTHFAIVSNAGSAMVYQNGVALKSTATTIPSIGTGQAPSANTLCFATQCNGAATPTVGGSGTMFGGNLANFTLSTRTDYSGTSTSSANFTPPTVMKVDASTVFALQATNSSSSFVDLGPNNITFTNFAAGPTGSLMAPTGAAVVPEIITTQGVSVTSSAFIASNGTGNKTFTMTSNNSGLSYSASANQSTVTIANTVTATNSTTAKILYETLTATDSVTSSINVLTKFTINPPIALSATSANPTTAAGVAVYDTITATFGTGTKRFTYTDAGKPGGLNFTNPSTNVYLLTADKSVPQGIYTETVTATDAVGATTVLVITLTVNPGLSLTSNTGSTSVATTAGKAASLRLNAANGSGTRTFTMAQAGISQAAITLDSSTAASGYVTVNYSTALISGNYSETVTVTDTTGGSAFVVINATVAQALTLSYNGATTGTIALTTTAGSSLTTTAFSAALGTGTRSISLSGLNSAISIDTSTTNIGYVTLGSGLTSTNSTTARVIYETVTATDAVGFSVTRALAITVNPAIALAASTLTLTTTAGVAITDTFTATYGTGNKTFSITAPAEVSGITKTSNILNQTTITIPGGVGPGTYTITITATDSVGATTSINVTLNVNAGVTLAGSASISMTAGYGITSGGYSASNGTGSITFALNGTLNSSYISIETITSTSARLKVTSSAASNGSLAATYFETITATDSLGGKANLLVTLTVNPIISLSGTQTLNSTFGVSTTSVYQITGGTAPYYISGSSICAPVQTTDGAFTVLSFVAVGSCNWQAPAGVSAIDYLVVGGGGGGDRGVCSIFWGHGGGGGEVIKATNFAVVSGTSYSVSVGRGGAGSGACQSTVGANLGTDGSSSTFNSTTARGGKASLNANYGAGGSSGNVNSGGIPASAYPTTGYASAGYPAGGGGGAGGAGNGLNGGIGIYDSITGTTLMYGAGGAGKNDTGFGTAYEGGAANSAPTPNRGGGGSDQGPSYSSSYSGASGVVVLRYLTPSSPSSTQLNIYTDSYLTSPGRIVVTVPDSITVGTYVETFTVTDSAASPATNTYVVTINVAKATPSVSLALPGGATTGTYGSPSALTATASTGGAFTFKKATTIISTCVNASTSGGSATCSWTPTDTSTVTMSAIFTPTDLINYNSATTSNFVLTVAQADTLTVTFNNQTVTYSESGTAVSRAFTLSGLASIDSITAVATALNGTANDASTVNIVGSATYGAAGTSTVTKAGTFSLSGTGVTFSGSNKSSNYKAIVYEPGTITVNRAGNVMSFNYGTSNSITYKPTGTESVTATYKGSSLPVYSTVSSSNCAVDPSSGSITTSRAGSCDISMAVAQSANYFGDTVSATVAINKASRAVTLTSSASTLKYSDTASVTTTITFASDDGVLTYSNGTSTGCSFDSVSGVVTATSGTATCTLTGSIAEGINYLAATSSGLTITLAKADAPVVTLTPPANVNYSPTATLADMPLPTYSVSGLKFNDTATALSNLTITYINGGSNSYNSTTIPVGANVYTVVPSALTLAVGSISNYNTPTYNAAQWTINQISQDSITVNSVLNEDVSVPLLISYSGGTTNGVVTGVIISGGSASNCTFSAITLQANSTGTCFIRIKMAGNQNYFDVWSDTYTVTIAKWTQTVFNFDSLGGGSTGISISSQVPFTVGEVSCSSACQPTITSVSPTSFEATDLIIITGTDFAGASQVIFNRSVIVTDFTVTGNDTIAVKVPAGLTPGPGTISVVNGGKISFRFSGLTVKTPTVVG